MKILFVNLLIISLLTVLTNCSSNNDADRQTQQATIKAVDSTLAKTTKTSNNADSTQSELSFLKKYDLKHPYRDGDNFLEKPVLKKRLEKLLGDQMPKLKRFTFISTFALLFSNGVFQFNGYAQNSKGIKEAQLMVDIPHDAIFVGILDQGKIKIFKEKADVAVPKILADWKDQKIQFGNAAEVK